MRTAFIAFVVFLAGNAFGASAPSTIDPDASCTTAECHTNVTKGKPKVHGAVENGLCTMCHEPKGKQHSFAKVKGTSELCNKCHDAVDKGAKKHPPIQDGCLECHDPHSSKVKGMLRADNEKALCFGCHDDSIMSGKFVHGPAAVGACTECHNPHSSSENKLLKAPPKELCAKCHADFGGMLAGLKHQHEPAKGNCTACHNPHSGPSPKMLPAAGNEMCAKCHEDVVKKAKELPFPHAPVVGENGCVGCHSPHGSDNPAMLKDSPKEVCLGCHNKSAKSPQGNIKSLLEANKDWHGPIRDGNCTGCHQPHGSSYFKLLKASYPPKFYSSYDKENYALCFTCHEPSAVTEQYTKTLTGFRDGDKNLHYLHVNKQDRGRTCRSCHEVHASQHPRHIRDSVPYGSWDMPIAFEKTETGGSCQPGCHAAKSYKR